MKLFVNLFFVLTIFCLNSESVVIDCEYLEGAKYYGEEHPYRCIMGGSILVTSKDDREVTAVSGDHTSGKIDDDVTAFYSESKTINYFPRGITKFFKNIDRIDIIRADLKEITKDDLKEFGDKLKKLEIYYNQIEFIEADLFIYNVNLEWIVLRQNKIKHIVNGAFDGLEKLHTLNLNDNPCTNYLDQAAYSSQLRLLTIIRRVESKCKSPN